ncbi:hypothetical protein ACIOJF_01120 [Glutamicibacter sp. NPDC087831]|uniref:hypothetical protein n=1 Tax=Glutamicibacter sp. NPDC087831 TaxID=3363998 RepID=UPI003811793D
MATSQQAEVLARPHDETVNQSTLPIICPQADHQRAIGVADQLVLADTGAQLVRIPEAEPLGFTGTLHGLEVRFQQVDILQPELSK